MKHETRRSSQPPIGPLEITSSPSVGRSDSLISEEKPVRFRFIPLLERRAAGIYQF
jgi:hypothetical protein